MSNNDKNPWLGLKTYSEGQIIYGRSEEINALSQDILFNKQTIVYGKSGIGKSSLLNAGVFPILRRSNLFPVNVRLIHNDSSTDYFTQIKNCVENSLNHLRRDVVGFDGKKQTLDDLKGDKYVLCPAILNKDGESLWEYFHRHKFKDEQGIEIHPVVVFDQFEEIFTLCKDEDVRKTFFTQLADLLNDVPPSYIYEVTQKTQEETSGTDEIIDGSEDFILIEDNEEDAQLHNYLQESNFHIVITLREDFLSYLERYTTNIPLLKHNRYCLRPLSDDQAGAIITDPVPGLISEDVAVEIICKVTKSKPSDFKLGDGIMQLEVDSAILSLFLSELYKKKAPEDSTISIELVRAIGDNIISSFYENTISNISQESAEYLEKVLVTDDERRDSVFEDRAEAHGVTKEELKYLMDERLIHEFPWNDDGMRIEFMHDILCSIIVERKKNRKQKRIQEEENRRKEEETKKLLHEEERKRIEIERKAEEEKQLLLLKQSKRNRIFLIIIITAVTIILPLLYNSLLPPTRWELLLLEDQTVGSENYWKAEVLILNESSDTLYPVQILDKTHFQATYPQKVNEVRVVVQFLAGNFNTIDTVMDMRDSLIIPISRAHGRKKYGGKVIGEIAKQPLKNAVVIVGSQIAKTDQKGFFIVYVDQTDISNDGTIKIFKSGYNLLEAKIEHDSTFYTLQLEDPKAFDQKLSLTKEKIAEVPDSIIEMTGEIAGSLCHIEACIKSDSIYGIYYYDRSIKQENNIELVKIVFSGKLNSDKTFHLDACDRVYNLEEFNGRINDDGSWEGYWHSYSPVLQNFKFKRN